MFFQGSFKPKVSVGRSNLKWKFAKKDGRWVSLAGCDSYSDCVLLWEGVCLNGAENWLEGSKMGNHVLERKPNNNVFDWDILTFIKRFLMEMNWLMFEI